MKRGKNVPITLGILLGLLSLKASLIPDEPERTLDPLSSVKVVAVYAIGEWSGPDSLSRGMNIPLPGYAFDVWDPAEPPSIPDYYDETSNGRFTVDAEVWHKNLYCYVMEGFYTPTCWGNTNEEKWHRTNFVNALIDRIEAEDDWSFAENAMFENDPPAPGEPAYTWIYVIMPDPDERYGGWGVAPSLTWDIPVDETKDGHPVHAHIFAMTRDYTTLHDRMFSNLTHEFNHQWCPDIGYHPDHYGLGGFDPQGAALHFSDEDGPLCSPLNPKWRHELGWLELANLTGDDYYNRPIYDQTMDTVYRAGNFYVSTHRRLSFYESKWPGQGLMVWHVTAHDNTRYAEEYAWRLADYSFLDKPIDLEVAHGNWHWDGSIRSYADPFYGRDNLDKRGYYPGPGNVGDSACFFWPDYGYTQFDGLTNPTSREHTYGDYNLVISESSPQKMAIRGIEEHGVNAMRADILYDYCIPSNLPEYPIRSGANNQRSLVPSVFWYLQYDRYQTYAYVYVDDDPILFVRISTFEGMPNAAPQRIHVGDSVVFPAVFCHGQTNRGMAICWLDGTSLHYSHFSLKETRGEIQNTNVDAFDLSTLDPDWPGFTAPAIVVGAGDSVFIATGVSIPYLPTGEDPPWVDLPVICFRFHKFNPAGAIVDTLVLHRTDTIMGLGRGGMVSLAVDANNRVHAVYSYNDGVSTGGGHRYYENGSWATEIDVLTEQCYAVGPPCLEFCPAWSSYPDRLYCVASSKHPNHPTTKQVYCSWMDVSGPVGDWNPITSPISSSASSCYDPVITGKDHVFWGEDGELIYKHRPSGLSSTVSNTPHAHSSNPQALYDPLTDNVYLAWRESNNFGSEIDLRTLDMSGGIPSGGGQSSGDASIERAELDLSTNIFTGGNLYINYTQPVSLDGGCLKVYDCQGRLVREWELQTSNGTVLWDGSDSHCQRLAAGVYFVRLETGERGMVRKLIKLK